MNADPKPLARERNPDVFKRLHAIGGDCLACGSSRVELHHILSRARGGDDIEANLIFLCPGCHGAYHGNPYRGAFGAYFTAGTVQSAIGRYLQHEAGDDARNYILRKLGAEAGALFLEQQFGVELFVIDESDRVRDA